MIKNRVLISLYISFLYKDLVQNIIGKNYWSFS